jgi:hypothetical protein
MADSLWRIGETHMPYAISQLEQEGGLSILVEPESLAFLTHPVLSITVGAE